jgi:tRNA nucleotidyltransferase (CCA-adding enzyme)
MDDLKNKIIRTPLDPDVTFSDDPLRMMRAIRFATQLNFEIDENSLKSITKNCQRIQIITGERIVDELNKILSSSKPSVGFILLYKTGLLDLILPELTALNQVEEIEGQTHRFERVKIQTSAPWFRVNAGRSNRIAEPFDPPRTRMFSSAGRYK